MNITIPASQIYIATINKIGIFGIIDNLIILEKSLLLKAMDDFYIQLYQ